MANELEVSKEPMMPFTVGKIRGVPIDIYGTSDEPMFLLSEVSELLEYPKTNAYRLLEGLDEGEKLLHTICGAGQTRSAWLLTEDGLNEVIMQSNRPVAKEIKRDFKVLLKQLRRGELSIQMTEDELLAKAYILAQSKLESKKREVVQLTARVGSYMVLHRTQNEIEAVQVAKIQDKENTIAEMKPKADWCDHVERENKRPGYLASDLAMDYGMNPAAFNRMLWDLGIQYKNSSAEDAPFYMTVKYLKEGYAFLKRTEIKMPPGHAPKYDQRLRWTVKGCRFLYNYLKKHCNLVPVMEREDTSTGGSNVQAHR